MGRYDDRGSAASRGYGHAWRKAREGFLRSHPLCVMHQRQGKSVPATVVDHITPHRGDMGLFWDKGNWQALCAACHDSAKQRLERSGTVAGCDLDGNPIDPASPWAALPGGEGQK